MRQFDLSLKINGFDISKAKEALTKIQAKDDYEFIEYIELRKKEILNYHLTNNPFYKSIVKTHNLNNWSDVPVMTKKHLQQPLTNRFSVGFNKKNTYVNKTSGSSGDPFVFAKDKWSHALTWAVIMDRFSWFDLDFNSSRQARFYGIPLDKMGYYKERLKDWFGHRYRFSVFDLTDNAFEKVLTKFKSTLFDYINGYTSPIVQFAKYLERENIVLKEVCTSLKTCITTSEMLFKEDKLLLEKQFGVPIINEYGASELDLIAFQNKQNEWVINSETLYVEILDDKNNILPYGEEGRIVITSLFNKAHPFIRYDIGDVGILSTKSSIRKPILEKLIGRTNDIVLMPSGKKAAGLTFYYVTKSVIEDDGNVSEFIIEQISINHFNIKYVSKSLLSQKDKSDINDAIIKYLEHGIKVTFERQEKLQRTSSGKLKQFISYLN